MAIESPAPAATPPGRLTGIIDSDVHPNFNNGLKDLHEYFPKAWQEKLGTGDVGGGWKSRFAAASYVLPLDYLYINVVGAYRKDSDGEGMAPGTDAAFTAKQLLDPHGIEKGVLMAGHLLGIGDEFLVVDFQQAMRRKNCAPVRHQSRVSTIIEGETAFVISV